MQKRKNFGLFMGLIENEFSNAILMGASKAAAEVDANLIVFPINLVDGRYVDEKMNSFRYQYNTLLAFLQSQSLDGAIVEYGTIFSNAADEQKRKFLDSAGKVPTVLLAERAEGYTSICVNNKSGLRETVKHLVEKHHCRKIAFVSGPKENHDANERKDVYIETMKQYGLYQGEEWIYYGDFSFKIGGLLEKLLTDHPDVEAIMCANDQMAMSTYETLRKHGKEPGRDVLVTGFDDIPSSILQEPPLTTVKADASQLAYDALYLLNNEDVHGQELSVDTHMMRRKSCGCSHFEEDDEFDVSEYSDKYKIKQATKEKIWEAERRKEFEMELGNIIREMGVSRNANKQWLSAAMNIFTRIKLGRGFLMLYRNAVHHASTDTWCMPDTVDVRAWYDGEKNHYYAEKEFTCETKTVISQDIFDREERYDLMVTPLFYWENQYGLFMVDCDPRYFQFVFQVAGQISSAREIIRVLQEEERIKQELAIANEYKSQFLANMSHEIRTPINAIIGMNEMILRENEVDSVNGYANDIKNAAQTLLLLVNDILDFSKLESGKMELVPVVYQLQDVLHNAVNMIGSRAASKGLKVKLEYEDNLPTALYGDDVRIGQILLNILSNAVKYTEEGSVTLKVSGRRDADSDKEWLRFEVTDTGIGIRKEDLSKLFEKFERIEQKRNRNIEGTGLGMNITAGLLQLMDSKLEVESEYNVGSTFSFTICQKIVDATPISMNIANKSKVRRNITKQESKFKAPNAHVLVVDDNAVNRKVITNLLKRTEIHVDEASGGKECLEKTTQKMYDLVLLDHMMPEMDGIETLAEIRKREEGTDQHSIVIALTANAIQGVEQMYLEKGFDSYLSKPISPVKLEEAMLKYLPEEKIEKKL